MGTLADMPVIDESTLRGRAGFHRVGRDTRGRWWFVGPDNRPWFHRGIDSVGAPSRFDAGAGDTAPAIEENTPAGISRFVGELGFNAFGAWSSPQFAKFGWPVASLVHVRRVYPAGTIDRPGLKHIDVFDPQFPVAYEARFSELAREYRDNPNLLGWFCDNEPAWGQPRRDTVWGGNANVAQHECIPTLLQCFLTEPRVRPAHDASWEWICSRHGGIRNVADRWGLDFADPVDFLRLHEAGLVLGGALYREDLDAFSRHYAMEYFRIVSEVIRRHDPNHLILGPRHGGHPGACILDAQREAFDLGWCDVLTMNCYRATFADVVDEFASATGMPILNGEFSWASDYFKWPHADGSDGDMLVHERTIRRGVSALESAIAHPSLVGYSWFKFQHNFEDPEGPHYGLVNLRNEANRFNARLLREIHARADGLARGRLEPRLVEVLPICSPSELERVGIA
jgi:hypothetical protein